MIYHVTGGFNVGLQLFNPDMKPVKSDGEDVYDPPYMSASDIAYTFRPLRLQYALFHVGTNALCTEAANVAGFTVSYQT